MIKRLSTTWVLDHLFFQPIFSANFFGFFSQFFFARFDRCKLRIRGEANLPGIRDEAKIRASFQKLFKVLDVTIIATIMDTMKIKQDIITWAAELATAYNKLNQTDIDGMDVFVYDQEKEAYDKLELEQMASAFKHLDENEQV